MADHVDANPHDEPLDARARPSFRLEQNAGHLLSIEQDIIRPFATQLDIGRRNVGDCVDEAERGDETELSRRRRSAIRTQDEGDEEVAENADTLPPAPAMPCRLLAGPDDRA